MRIALLIPGPAPHPWHAELAAAVSEHGTCTIVVDPEAAAFAPPAPLRLLWWLDRTLHGGADTAQHAPVAAPLLTPAAMADAEVVIDLRESPHAAAARPTWLPLYDGHPGETGLWSALLEGKAPQLAVREVTSGRLRAIGQPALETPHRLQASARSVRARMIEGVLKAVTMTAEDPGTEASHDRGSAWAIAQDRGAARAAGSALRTLNRKAHTALQRLLKSGPQWAVAMRPNVSGRGLPSSAVTPSDWTILRDDGQRYYADPFILEHAGQRVLFVEEFPYATGRGLIAVARVDAEGRAGVPRPVLEIPHHLSYPQIFVEDGQVYMLPEAAQSGSLTLYRADAFPNTWVPAGVLIDAEVHDATLVRHAGRYWIFAATRTGASSSWDALSLYSAPALLGPWTAMPGNPQLVAADAARPAGALFAHDGALWRPAQDCTGGYGAALSLARVDRLDATGYRQTVTRTWRTEPGSGLLGPHTWNLAAGLEAIDLYGPRRRLGGARP